MTGMGGRARGARRVVATAALVGLVGLSGCATIPRTGPVEEGVGGNITDEGVLPILPQIPENDPVRLVDGFLKATAAGVAGDFEDVRGYLSGSAYGEWDPTAGVTIYGTGDFTPVWDEATQTVTYSLPVAATLDSRGRMTEVPPGTRTTVVFGVTSALDDRWRISSLDDGIVISEANFALVYRPVDIAFASRDLEVEVPDLRWLPRRNIATHATLALLAGPSPWMEDAVATGIGIAAELDVDAVPMEEGRVTVALASNSIDTAAHRALAGEQFSLTLGALAGVTEVVVSVGGLPLGGDGSVSLVRPPIPSAEAAVVLDGRIGVWDGDQFLVAESGGALPSGATDIALAWDGQTFAALTTPGTLATGVIPANLVPAEAVLDNLPIALTTVVEGDELVAPSFDRDGWLWTAEASGSGALMAIGPAGERVDVPIKGAEGRDISAIAIARDGARVVVLSREGGLWRLGVAGIIRSPEGVPISVGAPLDVGIGVGPSRSIAWVDDHVVAVLGTSNVGEIPSVLLVTVGGRTEVIAGVLDAVGLAARSGTGSLILVARDGSLYARTSTAWSPLSFEGMVASLAYSG